MEKTCIACGMPMTKDEDFPQGDMSKGWCVHCAHEDGSMRSYDETLEGMTQFMMKSQGLAQEPARNAVKEMMSRLPAWKNC